MKIAVLGATGRTGAAFVRSALERGHTIRAMGRRIPVDGSAQVEWTVGDVSSMSDLSNLLMGQDALVSCLGQRFSEDEGVLGQSAHAAVNALRATGVSRLLIVSQGLLNPSRSPIVTVLRLLLSRHVRDSRQMETAVTSWSGNWTIVRPPRLTDGPASKYRATIAGQPASFSMSRSTLAEFLVDAIDAKQFFQTVVGIGTMT